MDGGPGKPCGKSMHSEFAALQNGIAFTDNRHVAFVEIANHLMSLLTSNMPGDQGSNVAPLLDRYLGHTR